MLHANFKKQATNKFYIKINNDYNPDLFTDELALSINTKNGLVIVTGCSHSGILNILEKIAKDTNAENMYALLGGLHLASTGEEEVKQIAEKIKQYNVHSLAISHCTGNKLAKYLAKTQVFDFNVGDCFSC